MGGPQPPLAPGLAGGARRAGRRSGHVQHFFGLPSDIRAYQGTTLITRRTGPAPPTRTPRAIAPRPRPPGQEPPHGPPREGPASVLPPPLEPLERRRMLDHAVADHLARHDLDARARQLVQHPLRAERQGLAWLARA